VYETVSCLSNYTRKQLENRNYNIADKCLRVAGRLYERGNQVVKGAIEQHFLPALSGLPVTDANYRIKLYSLVPASLYTLFIQQQIAANPQINKQ
jgi:hypothetical protein